MPEGKRLLEVLGSKRVSIIIFKTGAVYFLVLSILWFANLKPPAPWMFWGPFTVWAVFFLINITISVTTKKYAYKGNLLFHIAFIIVLIGAFLSALYDFRGTFTIVEGSTFWGDEREYTVKPSMGAFRKSVPRFSLRLDNIEPGFWKGQLYFVKLEAKLKYPAETLENTATAWLNGGPTINGVRLRLKNYGFFPEVTVEQDGRLILKGPAKMLVFPPGTEDSITAGNYKVLIKVFSDPKIEEGRIRNASMEITDPVFLVRVEWLGNEVLRTIVRKGESIRAGDLVITFTGLKKWVEMAAVKDLGEPVIFLGFIIGGVGLVMRLFPLLKKKVDRIRASY